MFEPSSSFSSQIPGLYVHIPFCRTKCPYCGFFSVTSLDLIPEFLDALFLEMAIYRDTFRRFDSLYIGGGTPSILSPPQLGDLMDHVRKHFILLPQSEITVEVNPGDREVDFFQALRSLGVNRLNIGVQSFQDDVLHFLGRRHSAGQAVQAIDGARKAGFNNIGLDLIYEIPGQTRASWLDTLHQAITFAPEHLSCYQLTIDERTPLAERYRRQEFVLPGEEEEYEFFVGTAEALEGAGYRQYEVSNFARKIEYSSRHNQKYWDHTEYLGLGPAAHSFANRKRWWNTPSLSRYIQILMRREAPVQDTEILSLEQLGLEALALGFRTRKGFQLSDLSVKYHLDLWGEKKEILQELQREGLLLIEGDHVFPTRAGLAVADRLALI
ncbi:MAG: radical SAM family heme chaperone HemW [Deltaproteobacteria bacterium]|nr:radical SAM family heme chaperone HemW [Deltaproteobacteria bacterium]